MFITLHTSLRREPILVNIGSLTWIRPKVGSLGADTGYSEIKIDGNQYTVYESFTQISNALLSSGHSITVEEESCSDEGCKCSGEAVCEECTCCEDSGDNEHRNG